ncbi:MAG: nitronate monooxygenase, partial [Anaerohalosphaera sp.]|nr:nitronate monooxygenase [Anaerohalosphaera sp.]
IVSSGRTFKLICRRWKKHYNTIPDAVVVEGPMAGGHLGYTHDSIANDTADTLEDIVKDVLEIANSYDPPIPVIAAGGIYDGSDIARFLKLGASGVQMATRFVCTDECDADINFKMSYINANAGDITIIESPVGLPGRVIKNDFVTRVKNGQAVPIKCNYKCLRTCNPKEAPYCIAKVLANAADGKMDESFSFAGSNAWRCTEIVPVKVLVDTLVEELKAALNQGE